MLYLDHAATSPLRPEVREVLAAHLDGRFGNPSSVHAVGAGAAAELEDARTRVARVLGVRRSDVVFTSGATESDNLAVKGIAVAAHLDRGARHVVTTPVEHDAVLASVEHLRRVHAFDVTLLPVDGHGRVDPDDVTAAVRDDTALVSVAYADNEIGTVQDIPAIVAALRSVDRRVPLHVDAVQAAGWLDVSAGPGRALEGVDAVALGGHKIGAPVGTGVLAVRGRIPLEPLLHGGGQENGRRSGTEDVAGASAFATALELADAERVEAAERVVRVRDAFVRDVLALVPGARLTGHPEHRLPGNASFAFRGVSGEAVLLELERRGILTSSGSACAAGSDEPSAVLRAIGLDDDTARSAVRFTLSPRQHDELTPVAAAVADAVRAASGR